jgi:hypothetical protein
MFVTIHILMNKNSDDDLLSVNFILWKIYMNKKSRPIRSKN